MRTVALVLVGVFAAEGQTCVVSPEAVILHDPIAALNQADSVFYATVRSWTQVDSWTRLAELEVHEVWKGQAVPRLFNYFAPECSVRLEGGTTYLVYAHLRSDGQLQVTGSAVPANRAAEAVAKLREHVQ